VSVKVVIMSIGLGLERTRASLIADPQSNSCRSRATGVFEVNVDLRTRLNIPRNGDIKCGTADYNASERALFAVVVTVVLVVMIVVLARAVVVVFVTRFAVVMTIVGRVR